ncbi:hypothetical protein K0M31_016042 [Melipona bicolor]|uniref:Uncharacterized protein n=1 Tax=Melipona bicolor TaxID=60889 RepID=A0AA40KT52_9HYME|nr:hypothetical protein K0M31_016042 [Melipona bicolor]
MVQQKVARKYKNQLPPCYKQLPALIIRFKNNEEIIIILTLMSSEKISTIARRPFQRTQFVGTAKRRLNINKYRSKEEEESIPEEIDTEDSSSLVDLAIFYLQRNSTQKLVVPNFQTTHRRSQSPRILSERGFYVSSVLPSKPLFVPRETMSTETERKLEQCRVVLSSVSTSVQRERPFIYTSNPYPLVERR